MLPASGGICKRDWIFHINFRVRRIVSESEVIKLKLLKQICLMCRIFLGCGNDLLYTIEFVEHVFQ